MKRSTKKKTNKQMISELDESYSFYKHDLKKNTKVKIKAITYIRRSPKSDSIAHLYGFLLGRSINYQERIGKSTIIQIVDNFE